MNAQLLLDFLLTHGVEVLQELLERHAETDTPITDEVIEAESDRTDPPLAIEPDED